MTQNRQLYTKAIVASVQGLCVQLITAIILMSVGRWTRCAAAVSAAWFAFAGVPVWLCALLLYWLHKSEGDKALGAGEQTQPHRDPIGDAYRVVLRPLSIFISVYLLWVGTALYKQQLVKLRGPMSLYGDPLLAIAFIAAAAFAAFIVGRYLSRISRVAEWQLLRSGNGYLLLSAWFAAAVAVGFAAARFRVAAVLRYLALIVPLLTALVGLEIAAFLLLGLFRPRRPGERPRPGFDSRLLGLLSSPEGIGRAVRDTLDYQFGFEVSRSWFLELLARFAWLPIALSAAMLVLMSCLVIVEPQEQAILTRFGRLVGGPLEPGLHWKAPWPIDIARTYGVTQIRRVHVGSHKPAEPGGQIYKSGTPILWTNIHGIGGEQLMIVAPPGDLMAGQVAAAYATGDGAKAPSISLVGGDIAVEFRIRDLVQYVRHSNEPEARFEHIAQLEASRELYQYDVDSLVGLGRIQAGRALRERIQKAADNAKLGLEVLQVGLTGIHPAQQVAESFHATVTAQQEREASIENGKQYAVRAMTGTVGEAGYASKLAKGIEQLEQLGQSRAPADRITEQSRQVEELLRQAGGSVSERLADARAYRWQRENAERGKAERFTKELMLYNTAPLVYRMAAYLQVLELGLAKARKYMLVADRDRLILRFDFKDIAPEVGGAASMASDWSAEE